MNKSVQESLSISYDVSMYRRKPFYAFFKRMFDFLSSFLALLLLSWLFIILAIIVKCTSKGPVFYGHERIGKNGKKFKVWKFRSMISTDKPLEELLTEEQLEEYRTTFKVTNDPRITKIGRFLRKTSLDELPQLFNIFLGHMSIVGWRPILQEELDKYGANKELLLKIKPGLTGFWASHGRSNTTYEDRIKMELYYVIKRGFIKDIKIIFKTAISVFKGDGAK